MAWLGSAGDELGRARARAAAAVSRLWHACCRRAAESIRTAAEGFTDCVTTDTTRYMGAPVLFVYVAAPVGGKRRAAAAAAASAGAVPRSASTDAA